MEDKPNTDIPAWERESSKTPRVEEPDNDQVRTWLIAGLVGLFLLPPIFVTSLVICSSLH